MTEGLDKTVAAVRTEPPFLDTAKNPHAVPEASPARDFPSPLEPLRDVGPQRRPTPAEEARTIVAGASVGMLATLTDQGDPWASVVTYGMMGSAPVMCVSRLALHGRNLARDTRASLAVCAPIAEDADPSDSGRVTLAGVAEAPDGEELEAARNAYGAAVRSAEVFGDFGDFTFRVLRIERVRWVGGFGRMASVEVAGYNAAEPDPVAGQADFAVRHLNADHADALLDMARGLSGHTDATSARCLRADRYGLDLAVETGRGPTFARVAFTGPVVAPDGLRAATVDLARFARLP